MKSESIKKIAICMVSVLCLAMVMSVASYAEVSKKLNYQGYLKDSEGKPVNEMLEMTFSIYDSEGTQFWGETQEVEVTDGIYNVYLGAVEPIALTDVTSYFLGVQVNGDAEMTPRMELTGSVYDIVQEANQEEGMVVENMRVLEQFKVGPNSLIIDAGTVSGGPPNHIYTDNNDDLHIQDHPDFPLNNTIISALPHRGQVGIGTDTPDAKLDVEVDGEPAATIGSSSNVALLEYSIALGANTQAIGPISIAMGKGAVASGAVSTAMGGATLAKGSYSVAMGFNTKATGDYSVAMGKGDNSPASGLPTTTASGQGSVAMGSNTKAAGDYSVAMGSNTKAAGDYSVAMGGATHAKGQYSVAMGSETTASGIASTAMGNGTTAEGFASVAMGGGIKVTGKHSVGIALNNVTPPLVVNNPNVMAIMGGNLGVGTTAPDAKVDISGVTAGDPVFSQHPLLRIREETGAMGSGWTTANIFEIQTLTGLIPTAYDDVFTVTQNGNVGIRTADPQTTLHVAGRALVKAKTDNDLADFVNEKSNVSHNSSVIWAAYSESQSDNPMILQATGSDGKDKFVVRDNGFVGVNTTEPQSELQVNGYMQLDIMSGTIPPPADCDNPLELGRMKVSIAVHPNRLYICGKNASGAPAWGYTTFQ